jgi:H+-transporting ATPase
MTHTSKSAQDLNRTTPTGGLTAVEAAQRLRSYGPNATPDERRGWMRTILGKFIAPVPCLLEAAIALQLYLKEPVEASVIGVLLVFNAVIGLLHESRAQATIEALKARLAIMAVARRDGHWTDVRISELVPGDEVKLSLGGVVPADVTVLEGEILLDQSTITGESLPVEASHGFETFAGALVRRGEAIAIVTATGGNTRFGRTAELVRTAHVTSEQQKAIFRVVRNLALINGAITGALLTYAWVVALPIGEFIPLVLISVLATVPVALPATFTLATAIGAQALAKRGVLPTRLSAVDEAASMDVLCSDKTGTLTMNELAVSRILPLSDSSEDAVIGLAALASSDGGLDPVDRAVRAEAVGRDPSILPKLIRFIPFDPATKMSGAIASGPDGQDLRIIKGAVARIAALCPEVSDAHEQAEHLERDGYRVLAVASGPPERSTLLGLLALSDPPRPDAAPCIAELRRLGVHVAIISGDAATTTETVARQVGVAGDVYAGGAIGNDTGIDRYEVFAGVLPEDKFTIVKTLQDHGHVVGMCGDGANDAPALRQAQIGIAVATATDVAKSAAGIVLTEPGLGGIVAAVQEGRITFQRILTYTLRSIVHKVRQVLFLAFGLALTGHSILTPMIMVLMMITGDFLAMSATTDNVVPSEAPNTWRIGSLTIAGAVLGICDLIFCMSVLAVGKYELALDIAQLQTLTLVTLVFSGQAIFYVVRERRRLWSSIPSRLVIFCSIADHLILPTLAYRGLLVAPIGGVMIGSVCIASIALAFALDAVKAILFRRLQMV